MVFLLVRPFSAKRVLGVCASREHWGMMAWETMVTIGPLPRGSGEKTVDGPTVLSYSIKRR